MKKIFFLTLFCITTYFDVSAQQDPHYTQYMYNMSVINPAYAGSKENLTGGLLYRKQWVNIEGAPSTGTLFANMPVGKNVGAGISVISDKLGPVEENNLYGDFSYTLKLKGDHKLAFGLKAGATFHKIGLLDNVYNYLHDDGDEVFNQNTNTTNFNLGTGVFYYTNKYYVALSIPNMIKTTYLSYDGKNFGTEVMHYFLTGGYVFDLSPTVKFKPFALIKSSFNSPTSIDVSTNFLFNEKFEAGVTYRNQDSFGAMVNYAITPNLKLGYAYDHITSNLKIATQSSHEVILLFDLNFPKKVSRSPRYF